jgi:hypothetical protein
MTKNERKQIAAWLLLPAVAATNGAVRDLTYGKAMGRDLAHAISCLPLAVAIIWWARFLARRWPVSGPRMAVRVGMVWLALTLLFEFGLGASQGTPLSEMISEYNVLRGRLWVFIPLITAAAPELARRFTERPIEEAVEHIWDEAA